MPKILILGAGPCGLGAAWRLKELGFEDFLILEGSDKPGGLASSFVDQQGFTWDVGGHVQFSHYEDFDRVMDLVLPNGWLLHQREAWVWMEDRFIPYPFQNNLWRLSPETQRKCLKGLESLSSAPKSQPRNFGEWINQSFGSGIAQIFMRPYNFKVWAYPPEVLSAQWVGERVASVDLEKIKKNIETKTDDVSWGPNSMFRFPKRGGTGAIWKAVAERIGAEKLRLNTNVVSIDPKAKQARLRDGTQVSYENLLSTIPLDQLARLSGYQIRAPLLSSHSHIVGIGLSGPTPDILKTKSWIYFPETNVPFYRVTVFSNYSPANVPSPGRYWSLMCEVSSSPEKAVHENEVIDECILGLLNCQLISKADPIVSKWSMVARPGYPTPSIERDLIVADAFKYFADFQIYSRGRFGAWKYEVSNQDHTFMQGFEWADWVLHGIEEETVFYPSRVNAPGKRRLRVTQT